MRCPKMTLVDIGISKEKKKKKVYILSLMDIQNKTKVIKADLWNFDLDFEGILKGPGI